MTYKNFKIINDMNFLNFLGSSTSSASSFMCPNCKKRTPHNRITIAEWSAINDPKNTVGKVVGVYLDVMQVTRVANMFGISHWKCCNCGLTTIRKSNGEIDTIGETGK